MSNSIQTNYVVKLVASAAAAAYNVLPSDTGKTIIIPPLGGAGANTLAITLPQAQMGLRYRFMVSGAIAIASAVTITTLPANIIDGSLINIPNGANPAVVQKAPLSAQVQFTATAVNGDYIDMNCDGGAWYVTGVSTVAAGLA